MADDTNEPGSTLPAHEQTENSVSGQQWRLERSTHVAPSRQRAEARPGPASMLRRVPARQRHAAHRWGSISTELPAASTALVGREREIDLLRERVLAPDLRLLTLLGPPGVGKTRLALALAETMQLDFPDGARFVSLGLLQSPDLVVPAIAQALDIREPAGVALTVALAFALRGRQLLLVLDNFEHVLPAAPSLAALLAACRGLKIVTTSRAVLHLSGEQQFPVPPLALPDLAQLPPAGELAEIPAVRLFVQRARAAVPDFALSASNARAIAEICVCLDGLPLAIELVAAQSKLLAPPDVLERLRRRLPLIVPGPADAPDRQRSLAAALDWSYALLSPGEQRVFRCLGVFCGRFTAESAEAIVTTAPEEYPDIVGVLAALVDQSLVRAEPRAGGGTDFWLLETIRTYALARLAASGELPGCRTRHAAYCLAQAEQGEAELWSASAGWWVARLEEQHADLRAALRWLIDQGNTEQARRLGGALAPFWKAAGHFGEGLAWLTELRTLPNSEETPAAAKVLLGASTLLAFQANVSAARPLAQESLRRWRALGDSRGIAWSLLVLGVVAKLGGDYAEAQALVMEGAGAAHAVGDLTFEALCRDMLAQVTYDMGDFALARVQAEAAYRLFRQTGYLAGQASAQLTRGWLQYQEHDYTAAEQLFEQSLADWRAGHEQWGTGWALAALGHVAIERGDGERARAQLAEALRLGAAHGDPATLNLALIGVAHLAASAGAALALRLVAAVARYGEAANYVPSPTQHALTLRWLTPARAALAPEAAAAAVAAGRTMAPEQAIDDALGSLARLVVTAGAAPTSGPWACLTVREREVAALVAHGLTNREIADTLVISEATVETHVKHILSKLGVHSRKAIVTATNHDRFLTT